MKTSAFQKLLREHRHRIFSHAFYFLRNREDAEDVTQEVFIRLWKHWDTVDKFKVVGWMLRVTHNCCIDFTRQRKASVDISRFSEERNLESMPSTNNVYADPELQLQLTETQKTLLSAMEALSERTRSMLLMHYFQGLKYEEIGEILDTKGSTVKVAVHRGRRELSCILENQFPESVGKVADERAM
ncbi:MAG: RNA polymerase sigma factor [bacterium]